MTKEEIKRWRQINKALDRFKAELIAAFRREALGLCLALQRAASNGRVTAPNGQRRTAPDTSETARHSEKR